MLRDRLFRVMPSALLLGIAIAAVAAPTTRPATEPVKPGPTTSPTAGEVATLLSGDLSFVAPSKADGWRQAAHAPNDRMIAYARSGPDVSIQCVMAINADEQHQVLRDDDAAPIGEMSCKRIRDNAKGGVEILDPPKIEKDDRFFLRIHHRFRKGGKLGDTLQLYRVMGLNLVSVAVTAYTDSPEAAKPIFETAEQVMLGIQSKSAAQPVAAAKAAKPITLADQPMVISSAKMSIKSPADWGRELSGESHGIVAKFHDPLDSTNLIAISVRSLPPEAKKDPKVRDAMIDQIVAGEKTDFTIEGAKLSGPTTEIVDRRFLRKVRTRLESSGARFDISSRQSRVGDAIVSVTVVCLDDQFSRLDNAADDMAVSLKVAGK